MEAVMQLEMGEFFEDINDALRQAVKALGGNKAVGSKLWPEKTATAAAQSMSDCLNADRREKLAPEQVVLILRMAREKGYHAAMQFIAFDTGYKATPVDPKTQEAELQERFIAAVGNLADIQAQLQRLQGRGPLHGA
jgi:hypothetical protein